MRAALPGLAAEGAPRARGTTRNPAKTPFCKGSSGASSPRPAGREVPRVPLHLAALGKKAATAAILLDRAADVFYRNVALMRFEFQEGIGMAIRKEVLRRRGVLRHAGVRAPGVSLDAGTSAALDRILAWTGRAAHKAGGE